MNPFDAFDFVWRLHIRAREGRQGQRETDRGGKEKGKKKNPERKVLCCDVWRAGLK